MHAARKWASRSKKLIYQESDSASELLSRRLVLFLLHRSDVWIVAFIWPFPLHVLRTTTTDVQRLGSSKIPRYHGPESRRVSIVVAAISIELSRFCLAGGTAVAQFLDQVAEIDSSITWKCVQNAIENCHNPSSRQSTTDNCRSGAKSLLSRTPAT